MRKLLPVLAILCTCGLAAAQSDKEPPKWSYVQAGFMDFNPDEGASDDGWFAGGSFSFLKMIHVFAEYDDVGDFTFWNAGAGWHGLLGDPGDVYAQVQWNDVSVDTGSVDVDDNGYQVAAGIRWKFMKWIEGQGEVNWADFDESGSNVGGKVGVLFTFLGDKLGAGASYEIVNDADQARVFARWNFGR
ncbi:MAG TPA: hypothetical protein VJ826_07115 [Candidatus Polarisedimenticolaceae bacterium]|nr:hypothetical protein [Candidatus Polarisedimenticolaceae bacterium]